MKKNTKKERKIPKKNYIYAFLILVGGILLILYICAWINVKKEEKLMNSYLISSSTINSSINDFDALKQILKETSSSYFIYIGYRKDEKVYNLEKSLKKIIDNYGINDNFYYFDVTELKENNKDYLKVIKDNLNLKDLNHVPAIIYANYDNETNIDILDGVNETILKASDLEQLLEVYDYEKIR